MNRHEHHTARACLSCWLAGHAGRILFVCACLYGVVLWLL